MCKKIICLTLCILLVAAMASPVYAQEENALKISNVEDFLTFAENCRLDTYSQGLTVSLEADLDLTGVDFAPVPLFSGTLKGNGHTVSGVVIAENGSEQGFFRMLSQSARVEDLHIRGEVTPNGSRNKVGGIAGVNAGVIQNCSFAGRVSGADQVGGIAGCNTVTGIIEDCRVEGNMSGNHFVGGVAGDNAGVIRTCENHANINTDAKENTVDISDITLETVIGTETVIAVTDIGGIAGCSSGVIRGCQNRGPVGYPYMGYNIGGIVGSLTGYLTECENQGAVSGRKDIGGIAGQMEPSILLQYEADTFQILRGQLETLADQAQKASDNAQTSTDLIQSYITTLQTHVDSAQSALNGLLDARDPDTLLAAVQVVGSSMAGIESSIRSLYQAVQDAGEQLEKDVQALAEQAKHIQGTLSGAEENLGGVVADVSDEDTVEDLTGKVSGCSNYGKVLGDWNIGGITGAMAMENDLDPEQDVEISGSLSFHGAGKLRSVILDCHNRGNISARKQNSGGIAGWQSMGLIKDCSSSGRINELAADYAGGIAGQSFGYIRNCSAKSTITGARYLGGIAGSGTVVTDCSAMCRLSGSERQGGILGFARQTDMEQPVLNNVYHVEQAVLGGIDGVDYSGIAQAAAVNDFFARENIHEDFLVATVTYRFPDGTVQETVWQAGDVLTEADVPSIPSVDGQLGVWQGVEQILNTAIWWDVTLEAAYAGNGNTIATEDQRDSKPVLLLQGAFSTDSMLTVAPLSEVPAPDEDFVLVDAVKFAVTESSEVTVARFLLPCTERNRLQVTVLDAEGNWKTVSHTVEGSYIVFPVTQQDQGFAVWQTPMDLAPWLIWGGVGLILLAGIIILVVCIRKKKNQI